MCFTFKKNNKQTKKPIDHFLQDDASAGIWSLQTSIEIKLCQSMERTLAKALSLFLIHLPFSSSGRGLPPAEETLPVLPPSRSNASTRTPIAIPIAIIIEAIIIPCSLNNILIFSANETSLSNTLANHCFETYNLVD